MFIYLGSIPRVFARQSTAFTESISLASSRPWYWPKNEYVDVWGIFLYQKLLNFLD